MVDVARDPRWGRIEETFGEDPYLVGEMGVAAVEGLQGEGKARVLGSGKVFATLKHLTGHGQPESGTNVGPAPYSERTLREYFFPPFEKVIERTGVERRDAVVQRNRRRAEPRERVAAARKCCAASGDSRARW